MTNMCASVFWMADISELLDQVNQKKQCMCMYQVW